MKSLLFLLVIAVLGCGSGKPECPELIGAWQMDPCATVAYSGNEMKDYRDVKDYTRVMAISVKSGYEYENDGSFSQLPFDHDVKYSYKYSILCREGNKVTVNHIVTEDDHIVGDFDIEWIVVDENTIAYEAINGALWAVFKRVGILHTSERTASLKPNAWIDASLSGGSYSQTIAEELAQGDSTLMDEELERARLIADALARGDRSLADVPKKRGALIFPSKGTRVLVLDSQIFPFIRVAVMYGEQQGFTGYVDHKFLVLDHPDHDLKQYTRESDINKQWLDP